ncbi:APX1 [Symbiodinium pilosum]|uniref:APX1 protein n=1 Tax=Symbiodinium pilosum TaxID=2952 RepID=A0A812JRK0_SYMPI|nr:APX1 [Symbiodinium pilosum]
MGNASCCKSDVSPDVQATVDAKPALDSSLKSLPAVAGGKTDKERLYSIKLVKSDGLKLGLDVDYMAERSVLPIMSVTGGVAEKWNQENPDIQIHKGDSIVEVNGTTGDVAQMLDKCKTDVELELTLCRCLNYDHLVADLEKLFAVKNCGPIMIRLSWHDAGVYNGMDGCPNAAMRLAGSGEHSMAANAGLPQVALSLLEPITEKYVPRLISHADLWALAANVAIKAMGGPEIPTRFGRIDASHASDGVPSAEGRLPDGDKSAQHIRDIFGPKGFDDRDMVALSGAHTVGMCHGDRSGFEGPWTDDKLLFDNSYFKDLLRKTWAKETNKHGKAQYRSGEAMMLTTDMALLEDPAFKPHVERYAADQKAWFDDFSKAWVRLQEFNSGELRDIL